MNVIIVVLSIVTSALLLITLLLQRTLKQTRASLQELLRESETNENPQQTANGDVYFKTDKNFNLTVINSDGARILGFAESDITGKPVWGTLLDDTAANREFLDETFTKASRRQTTFNTQMLIKRSDGKNMLFLVRIRPILNEILKCSGLSFLCKDLSKANLLKSELDNFQSLDPFTDILNEKTLQSRFEHDFSLATRYNRELSAVVVELKDLYDFIARGIDFETADKMLKVVSDVCLSLMPEGSYAGRINKTEIVTVLKDTSREDALNMAGKLFEKAVKEIKKLRVDEANAQMMVVSYSNRKGFTDSFDAMSGRIQRHIGTALKLKEYGIISSDCRQTKLTGLENIKG